MSCAVHRTSDMLTTSLTGADASMSAFTTPRIYTCLTDATWAGLGRTIAPGEVRLSAGATVSPVRSSVAENVGSRFLSLLQSALLQTFSAKLFRERFQRLSFVRKPESRYPFRVPDAAMALANRC
jgi:hypothetical protein